MNEELSQTEMNAMVGLDMRLVAFHRLVFGHLGETLDPRIWPRLQLACQIATLNLKGYLAGEQTLEQVVRGVRAAMHWVPTPEHVASGIVGMTVEAAADNVPRKRADGAHTPGFIQDTGGMLVEFYRETSGTQSGAFKQAREQLIEIGMVAAVSDAALKKWHQDHRKRLGKGPLAPGRPTKK